MNIDEMVAKLRQAHKAGKSITVKDGGSYVSVDMNADAPTTSKVSRGDMRCDGVVTKPSSLSPAEQADLRAFELSLANQNVTERHNQAHGGQKNMEQKERASAGFLHGNIHRQGVTE